MVVTMMMIAFAAALLVQRRESISGGGDDRVVVELGSLGDELWGFRACSSTRTMAMDARRGEKEEGSGEKR
jgi:hypothetical protein